MSLFVPTIYIYFINCGNFRAKKQNVNEIAVVSKKITTFIIRMYIYDQQVERCNYALYQDNPRFPSITEDIKGACLVRKRRSHEEENLHLEQKLLSKIYIVDQDEIFEKFCLQGSLEDNLNLLMECSNGLAFSSQPKVSYNCITKQFIVNDAIWFNPKTFQSCSGWIINEFEKAIALLYYQYQQGCIEDNNQNKNDDLKRFWIQDFELRNKILNQIPQICKEFKNAPKKKNSKQEYILWTQLILKQASYQNDKQINIDQNCQMMFLSINEKDVSTIFINNELEIMNYMPLEQVLTIQRLCQKRILRLIRDHYKEKLMKDIQEIEGKEKRKTIELKKKSKKHKKQKNKNEQKKLNMNQEKCNSFELADKQDTTQDEVHCNEYELEKNTNSFQEIRTNVQDSVKSDMIQNNKQEQNLIEEVNQILDAETIIDLSNNIQNDDDENWVVITAPKKQKKKSNRKFKSSQDNEYKNQQSSQKQNPPTFIESSVQTKSHNQELFLSQKSQKSNTQVIETVKQEVLMVKTEKNTKQENKEIDNRSSQNQNKMNQTCLSILEETKNINPTLQLLQLVDLSIQVPQESENLLQKNNNLNNQYEVQNTINKQPKKEDDQIDYVIMNQAKVLMIKKLDMDMREFNDIILSQNQQILKLRKIIYDRLQFVINYLFKDFNSQVRLFGSCATGLSLQESDIDIGITGFEMCPNSQLNIPIQKITEFLQKMRWVKNIVAITSSIMPLIKLQVDPTISFVQSSLPIGLPYIDLIINPDDDIHRQIFSVDISFFQYTGPKQNHHLGLISTELTLQWLSFYSELRPIILLFKSLLKKRGLNDQYKGGISSFCIIQMVLAFLECFYHQHQASSIGFTTYNFLKFYGTEFDPKTTGISYKGFNENPFYDLNEFDDQSEITIVSPITNEIISSASSFVLTILQDLKGLYQATENEITFFYEKLKYNKKKKGKKEERNLFQKELNRLRPLFSNTVYNKT
ncbi:unnamed protein product [Paramecium sonneborni]|uniref:Polymerase nucleotidyl transferase domain-containing protein n=1 Tax=Paramecium sonneborni TaxID=65129 RepID=A0A8S1LBF5_9CILI|nr:unnamed protein product [Paramecium sonneborni]